MSSKRLVINPLKADHLTAVYVRYRKNRINHRLRFGTPSVQTRLGWHESLVSFAPDQVFGYIRWSSNKYGTQDWRLFVCKAGGNLQNMIGSSGGNTGHHNRLTRIPGVLPGAHVLLKTQGTTRVKRALKLIDSLESETGDLGLVTESYWRHLHNRLEVNQPPHAFSAFQARMNDGFLSDDKSQLFEMDIS